MRFFVLISSIILLFFLTPFVHADDNKIKVGLAEWMDYTNADGSGIYLDIIHAIYGKEHVELNFETFNRAVHATEQGHYDLVIGVFREDVTEAVLPSWHLDYEYPIVGFYDPKRHSLKHPNDLYNLTVAWMRGYNFEHYLDASHYLYEVNTIKHGFQLLDKGRVDVFIDYPYNLPKDYESRFKHIQIMPSRPIYVAFSNTEKGRALAKKYDAGMKRIRDSGQLQSIYGSEYQRAHFQTFDPNKPTLVLKTKDINLLRGQVDSDDPSSEALLMSAILQQLPNVRVELSKMRDVSEFRRSNQNNVCYLNMLTNQERASRFDFSLPITMYSGYRVFSRVPFAAAQNVTLPSLVNADNKIGLRSGQTYSRTIMDQLDAIDNEHKVFTEADISVALEALVAGKIRYWIEYPSLMSESWPIISEETLYSATIDGSPEFTRGHIMCHRSADTRRFLGGVDALQRQMWKSGKHKHLLRKAHDELSDQAFDRLYRRAFPSL